MSAGDVLDLKAIRHEWNDARGEGFTEMQNVAFEHFSDLLSAVEALAETLDDLIPLAEAAMRGVNRDGAEYDTDAELVEARAALRRVGR